MVIHPRFSPSLEVKIKKLKMLYDVVIIGGGPAGVAAGVYSARKQLKTLFITFDFGGQSQVSAEIQNWIGTKSISGAMLAKNLEDHLRSYEGQSLTIKTGEKVIGLEKVGTNFTVLTDKNEHYETKTILITVGGNRRKLEIPGATEFDQKGLTYCASCDGPIFANKDVVVVGGGNAGFETASQLLAYTKSVTLLHRSPQFKADQIIVTNLLTNPRFKALTNAEPIEIKGDKFVTAVIYKNKDTGETKEIAAEGVFVEIGLVPNTDFVKNLVEANQYGAIVTDSKNQTTKTSGIWAAGDCTDALYHQNNIAAGDAILAIEDIYTHLHLK